jgi:ankyrin repeat protein
MLAARKSKSPDVVASLLASGASGQMKSRDGRTAFDYAAGNEALRKSAAYVALQKAQNLFELVRTAPPEFVTAALGNGAKAEDRDESQWTPLMCAAERNQDPRVIMVLLEAGAVVDSHGPGGWTPLMLAARANQSPDVVMALLKGGANGQVVSSDGKTAFELAAGNGKLKGTPALKALERSQNIFQLVRTCTAADVQNAVTGGADVNGRNEAGFTPLMVAAERNVDPKVIAALVKAGANLNDLTSDGRTALMLAAHDTKNPDVIMALLKAGADGLLASDDGMTAFDHAADNLKLKGTAALKALDKARTPPPATTTPATVPAPPAATAPSAPAASSTSAAPAPAAPSAN